MLYAAASVGVGLVDTWLGDTELVVFPAVGVGFVDTWLFVVTVVIFFGFPSK